MISFSLENKTALLSIADDKPENKFGIDNLKLVQEWKASVIVEIYKTLKKHKRQSITPWIMFNFWNEIALLVKVLRNIEHVTNEMKDLTNQESIDLVSHFNSLIKGQVPDKDMVIIEKINLMLVFVMDGVFDIMEEF